MEPGDERRYNVGLRYKNINIKKGFEYYKQTFLKCIVLLFINSLRWKINLLILVQLCINFPLKLAFSSTLFAGTHKTIVSMIIIINSEFYGHIRRDRVSFYFVLYSTSFLCSLKYKLQLMIVFFLKGSTSYIWRSKRVWWARTWSVWSFLCIGVEKKISFFYYKNCKNYGKNLLPNNKIFHWRRAFIISVIMLLQLVWIFSAWCSPCDSRRENKLNSRRKVLLKSFLPIKVRIV